MATLRPRTPSNHRRPHHVLRSQTDLPPHAPVGPHPTTIPPTCHRVETDAGPWQHMAQTYAWVVEQEFVKLDKRNHKTEQWILEQRIFLATDGGEHPGRVHVNQRGMWEEMMYSYEIEADRWMRQEEEAERIAAEREREREREKARIVQEEIRRIETRIRYKRDAERRKHAEEKARMYAELREREKRERAKADKATVNAWRNYEARWANLPTSSEPLTFAAIPWPVISAPEKVEDMTPAAIVDFLLSPFHSQTQTRKDKIRSAQLRWHPDRFRRLLGRVIEADKAEVEEGVGIVARCLNDLMSREASMSRQAR